ncbi:MAG: DUF58 domain-containing protein [Christensenellaceae bacterium]|nr:DUF58 domain-containing protein [Christensenellaceae bacterium]
MKNGWKARIGGPLATALVLLLAAFSTGNVIFLTASLLLLVCLLLGFLSVWLATRSLSVSTRLADRLVHRGEDVLLEIIVRHQGILPIAPLVVHLAATPDTPEADLALRDLPGKRQRMQLPFHAAHIGVSRPGVKAVTVSDLFGLFSVTKKPEVEGSELIVVPTPFDVDELTFAPGDSGSETMARATEDVNNPADVRNYQPGDAMKKIHWKLSLRKRELMVRRFEEPVLPDALVLMDCSAPPKIGHEEAEADMRDALLETAASVMAQTLHTDHAARLPLQGEHPIELYKGMGLPMILENLARADFSEADRFERVLLLETRRMRKVGATVIISARLNSRMVDVMTRMRKMGPYVRFYFVTFTPDAEAVLPLISKLQQGLVEVCYVTPVPA